MFEPRRIVNYRPLMYSVYNSNVTTVVLAWSSIGVAEGISTIYIKFKVYQIVDFIYSTPAWAYKYAILIKI